MPPIPRLTIDAGTSVTQASYLAHSKCGLKHPSLLPQTVSANELDSGLILGVMRFVYCVRHRVRCEPYGEISNHF